MTALESGLQMEKNVNKLLSSQLSRTKEGNSKLEKMLRDQGDKIKLLQTYFPDSRLAHLQTPQPVVVTPPLNTLSRTPSQTR